MAQQFLSFHLRLDPGLDPQRVTKLAVKFHAYFHYAYELVSTRRDLEKTYATNHFQDQEWDTASHPADPH